MPLLTIVNPGAEIAPAAPWVNVSNTLTRRTIPHTGSYCFDTRFVGAYDHYQAVAVPAEQIASVDAGTNRAVFSGYGTTWSGAASTLVMYLKALDGSGVVIGTWTATVTSKDNFVLFTIDQALPVGTRDLRIGWSGNCAAADDIWVDDLVLFIGTALEANKAVLYDVDGPIPEHLNAAKALLYSAEGWGIGLGTPKVVLYAATMQGGLTASKTILYLVERESNPACPEYPGPIVPCGQDRPNSPTVLCATRPGSVAEPCGDASRPTGNSFYPDQPYVRHECD